MCSRRRRDNCPGVKPPFESHAGLYFAHARQWPRTFMRCSRAKAATRSPGAKLNTPREARLLAADGDEKRARLDHAPPAVVYQTQLPRFERERDAPPLSRFERDAAEALQRPDGHGDACGNVRQVEFDDLVALARARVP